nr:hypothetical protein [Tanacetum cinerariifolium]
MNATLEAEVLTRSSHSSKTSYAIAADLSEIKLKKILIEKMEGIKSIQRSNEQRNLYKALVEAYDADKTILDTYGESTILKRRREDDDQEGPSAGLDRGSKRREKEVSMHQLALHLKQQLGVQEELPQGLNLDNCLPVSLLLQRNLCRLPVRWRNPHIRCLKQVPMINQLFKHLSILNGLPSQGDHLHRIVTETKLCQLLKKMLNHG